MKRLLFLSLTAVIAFVTGCNGPDEPYPTPAPPAKVEVTGVTLSTGTLTMSVGGSETLTVTISPTNATDKTITWSSDNPSVAKVDGGKVTAVAAGTAGITATAGSKSAVCTVTVNEVKIEVESISLDESEVVLTEGSSITLVATIAPEDATDKTIIWESGNEDIATVDESGKVTALAEGATTITATTSDGGKTATCNITVIPAPITAITIIPATITLKEGETQALAVEFIPAGSTASEELQWVSADSSIATVSQEGVVTAVAEGETTIAVRLKSNSAITAVCSVKVERDATLRGISLNRSNADLKEGATLQLEVVYNPTYATNKNVTWTSSNTAAATVDESGNVTAVAVGTTTITATSEDGGFTATCTINVVEKGVDIYTLISQYGSNKIYKNFEQYIPEQYPSEQINDMQIEDGDLYYTYYGSYYDKDLKGLKYIREIRKNGNKMADYTNTAVIMSVVNGAVYLITANSGVSPSTYHLHRINPDGTSHEINIPYAVTAKRRFFHKIVANAAGEVYILGQETDLFDETVTKLWVISSSENVSETVFESATNLYNVSDMTIDSNGDAWVILGSNSNRNECYLYKNGVYQETIATSGLRSVASSSQIAIRFNGSDRYIAYTTGTGIIVLKNSAVLYTIAADNTAVLVSDMEISTNGEVYMASTQYYGTRCEAYVYKNNMVLNKATGVAGISTIEIME